MTNSYCIYARCPAELAEVLRSRGIAITYVGRSHVFVRTDLEQMQLASISQAVVTKVKGEQNENRN